MSFLSEYFGVILFYLGIGLTVYINRDKFDSQGPLMYLLRTKLGLNLMDRWAKKYNKLIRFLGYFGIIIGYLGMVFVTYATIMATYDVIIDKPGAVGGGPIVPGLPVAGLGVRFPLIIGWISLFIIMIVHEFSHGVVARAHKVRVKSSGLAFFGPILGAFVEPDDKQIEKQKHIVQHSIFAAGPFSNVVLWIVCSLILVFLISPGLTNAAVPYGVKMNPIVNNSLPAYEAGLPMDSIIVKINDFDIKNGSNFFDSLEGINPNQDVSMIDINGVNYSFTTVENPNNSSKGYFGITNFRQNFEPKDETV